MLRNRLQYYQIADLQMLVGKCQKDLQTHGTIKLGIADRSMYSKANRTTELRERYKNNGDILKEG